MVDMHTEWDVNTLLNVTTKETDLYMNNKIYCHNLIDIACAAFNWLGFFTTHLIIRLFPNE